MCNYDLRDFVLTNNIYKRYQIARSNTYKREKGERFEGETLESFEISLLYDYGEKGASYFKECVRMSNSSYQRIKRLKTRIKTLLNGGCCVFLTLTFNDLTLKSTTAGDRKKLVKDFLLACGGAFIGNIDYGKKNDREHYHAVVCCDSVNYNEWHKNGAIKGEKITLRSKTEVKLARYIDKLALHSIKDTTFKNRLLYSN